MALNRVGSRFGRLLLAVATVVAVAAAMAFAMTRDRPRDSAVSAVTSPARTEAPARAARSPDEEAYLRALWPIHGDVQRSAMRLSLGQIFYKTQDLGRDELKARVDEAHAAFDAAESRLRKLAPPSALRADHQTYAEAVGLFKASAVEVGRMFVDGREEHMLAAYPRSQAASDKIREVGGRFWPHEFPPH